MTIKIIHLHYIAIVLLLFSCNATTEKTTGTENPAKNANLIVLRDPQIKAAGIALGQIEKRQMSNLLEVNGILDVPPQNMVSLSAMMGGFVQKTNLLQGLRILKGEEVVVLQNPEFIGLQQEYLSNRSKLEYLEKETNRQKSLASEQVTATKVYQQSLSELNSLKAMQTGLKERLELIGFDLKEIEKGHLTSKLSIKAPISGNVTEVGINLGKFVQPQDLICEIVNTDHLHAELSVFEQDLGKIKVGQHIHFFLESDPGKERMAHIFLINKKMNPDRTVRVHAHLDAEDKSLIPNLILKARIETSLAEMPVLPTTALVTLNNKSFVFMATEKQIPGQMQFVRVEVKAGIAQDGYTQIQLLEPAKPNARFAIQGSNDLLAMMENGEE